VKADAVWSRRHVLGCEQKGQFEKTSVPPPNFSLKSSRLGFGKVEQYSRGVTVVADHSRRWLVSRGNHHAAVRAEHAAPAAQLSE
jgi:hypothetical protein